MSKWQGKYVIGLTGNIGTGKSVVRRMLEHLGAAGIDADTMAHRAMSKGAPGYKPIVETFGKWLIGADGEINRARLGRVVFADPDALLLLEKITHPLVLQAVDYMVRQSNQRVIVIEAIKLLESNLAAACDSVWTVYAPPEAQLARLVQKRRMNEGDARRRIAAQPPQEQKMAAARVVIQNAGSFEDTWKQVSGAWQKFIPSDAAPTPAIVAARGEINVARGRPRDSEAIAALVNRVRRTGKPVSKDDIMETFGDKAFLLVRVGDQLVGCAGWQVENLVARTTDIVLDAAVSQAQVLPLLITEMERASRDLQCEAALVTVSADLSKSKLWETMGYLQSEPNKLGAAAWQEAALELLRPGQVLFFKQLRQDRVLRPI